VQYLAGTGDASKPSITVSPRSLAYIIFTSGSTGKPKGAMIEHRSVANLASALHKKVYSNLTGSLNVALLAPVVFDASVQQIFGALSHGHTLWLVDSETRRDGSALADYFERNGIDVADCTPSLLSIMQKSGAWNSRGLRLKRLIAGGEPLTRELVASFYEHDSLRDVVITNVYGPTECCVDVTARDVNYPVEDFGAIVPIGKPLSGAKIFVADTNGQAVPVGVPGEILIAGTCVGRGYINNSDLTDERFVRSNVFGGERLYKTGDMGRWNSCGEIEFIGRNDGQVKIRGYRIELGEVESALNAIPGVSSAAVAVKDNGAGKELFGYVVTKPELTSAALREKLAQSLPDYMLPSAFYAVERIPLNASGKTDRQALLNINAGKIGGVAGYEPPVSGAEKTLARIFEIVLDVKRVGLDDNYFSIGGDSIKALRIVSMLREEYYELKIRDLFMYPTIAGLAARLKHIEAKVEPSSRSHGPVPLTPIQNWFLYGFEKPERHFNQAILLSAKKRLNENVLRRSLEAVLNHHEALRARFSKIDGKWAQNTSGQNYPLDFSMVDLRGEPNPSAALHDHAFAVQQSINIETGPLLKSVLYKLPDGERLFLVCSHLAVDGVSWRIILDDLLRSYTGFMSGQPVQLPANSCSINTWASNVQSLGAAMSDWERSYWDEMDTAVKSTRRLKPFACGSYGERVHARRRLSKSVTSTLLSDANKTYNTKANDLLLSALALAYSKLGGERRMAVTLEGHGREPLFPEADASRVVGWFTSMYPVVLDMPQPDLGATIKNVKETLRKTPGAGIGYGALRYIYASGNLRSGFPEDSPEICFNYLGAFAELETELFSLAKETVGSNVSPDFKVPFGIEFVCFVAGGELEMSVYCDGRAYNREFADKLIESFSEEVENITAHCAGARDTHLTPSDIDYEGFGIEELDQFLNKL